MSAHTRTAATIINTRVSVATEARKGARMRETIVFSLSHFISNTQTRMQCATF